MRTEKSRIMRLRFAKFLYSFGKSSKTQVMLSAYFAIKKPRRQYPTVLAR